MSNDQYVYTVRPAVDTSSRSSSLLAPEYGGHSSRCSHMNMKTDAEGHTESSCPSVLPPTEWELHKSLISGLYIVKNLPLKDVQRELSEHYNFRASTKQWKERLKAWGFTKNVPAGTMDRILEGLGSTNLEMLDKSHIEFQGRQVPLARVKRHAQRTRSPLCRQTVNPDAVKTIPRQRISNGSMPDDITLVDGVGDITPKPVLFAKHVDRDEGFDFAGSPLPCSTSSVTTGLADLPPLRFDRNAGPSVAWSSNAGGTSRRDNSSTAVKLFACPYFKQNPPRFSARNTTQLAYRSCATVVLRNTAQIKQHLYRVHKLPDHYCARCLQQFAKSSDLSSHVRSCRCETQPTNFEGKMTPEQYKKIKRRQTKSDQRSGWYEIFDILFPGVPRPASPYIEDKEDQDSVHHMVNLFQSLGLETARDLYDVLAGRNPQRPPVRPLPAATRLVLDEAFETFTDLCSNEVYDQWISPTKVMSPCESLSGADHNAVAVSERDTRLETMHEGPDFHASSCDTELELADDSDPYFWVVPSEDVDDTVVVKQGKMDVDAASPFLDYV